MKKNWLTSKGFYRLLKLLVIAVVLLGGGGMLVSQHETAWEVLTGGFANVFGILTTPFILEISVAFVGIIAVMTYNEWKAEKETDEWVTMEVPQAPVEHLKAPITTEDKVIEKL